MPKKPKKPVPEGLLSIDATPATAKLDALEMAKINLRARHEADQRFAVSVKEALGMSQSKLYQAMSRRIIPENRDARSPISPYNQEPFSFAWGH